MHIMKKLRSVLITLSSIILSWHSLHAQSTFEVPQNVEFKSKEDYTKYESAVIEAAKWLETTDLDKEIAKRQQINAFIVQWVSGTPTVTMDLTPKLQKIYGDNTELLAIYLSAYARNYIENAGSATKISATKAALISMMNVYKKGIAVSKSKEMEKLIKLTGENKLDDYAAKI